MHERLNETCKIRTSLRLKFAILLVPPVERGAAEHRPNYSQRRFWTENSCGNLADLRVTSRQITKQAVDVALDSDAHCDASHGRQQENSQTTE